MTSLGLIELGLVFGVVLAVALWELYSVRKLLGRQRDDRSGKDARKDP